MTVIVWPSASDDSGTGLDGTALNRTFFDAIESGINTLAHSASNPTVTPVNIIDEVVTARGTQANLNALLDVEHNNDGTHNLPATVVTSTVLASSMVGVNLLGDPLFYCWSQGDAAAPDYYVLAGAGGTIDRSGTGQSTTSRYHGRYAAEITYGSATVSLLQSLWVSGDHANLDGFEGEQICLTVYVLTTTVNAARAVIDDGDSQTYSSYHAGGGGWSRLEVVHTISAAATILRAGVQLESAGNCVISAMCAVFSNTSSDRYIPGLSVIGTVVWPMTGTPADKDGQATAVFARPGVVMDVQVHAVEAGASGGVDFDIELGDGSSLTALSTNDDPSDILIVQQNDWTIQILDYVAIGVANNTVTVTFNGTATVLTADTDWSAVTSDDVTATNLATAISTISGLTATAVTDTVTVVVDDWNSIFAGPQTMDAADEYANFAAAPTAYADRCIAALHLDNGDHGTGNENAVLRLNIDDADSCVDLTFFVRIMQWLRPLEDALAYNTIG